jgi:hypothetical protein
LLLKTEFARNATQVKLEDEQHFFFLLKCGFYHNHRNKLFEAIKLTCKFVNCYHLWINLKLFWLLNSENINILTEISGFLLESLHIWQMMICTLFLFILLCLLYLYLVSMRLCPLWSLLWLIKNLNLYSIKVHAEGISTRLPNPILSTFVKNDKISSYYFSFKKKKTLMMCTYFIESSNFSHNFK